MAPQGHGAGARAGVWGSGALRVASVPQPGWAEGLRSPPAGTLGTLRNHKCWHRLDPPDLTLGARSKASGTPQCGLQGDNHRPRLGSDLRADLTPRVTSLSSSPAVPSHHLCHPEGGGQDSRAESVLPTGPGSTWHAARVSLPGLTAAEPGAAVPAAAVPRWRVGCGVCHQPSRR